MTILKCIFNETRRSALGGTKHIRQLSEDKDGNRLSMISDNLVNIINKGGIYTAKTSNGESVAANEILFSVISRITYANPSAEINVEYEGDLITLDRFNEIHAPNIYRIQYSDSERHGVLITIDVYKQGLASKPIIFETIDEALSHTEEQQGVNNRYYVATVNKLVQSELYYRKLGLETLEMTLNQADYTQLRSIIRDLRRKQDSESEELVNE